MTPENPLGSTSPIAGLERLEAMQPHKISYEDFIAQTSDGTWAEWIDGEVVFLDADYECHEVANFLTSLLRCFSESHGLGKVFGRPFLMKTSTELPGRAPDVFFVAQANLTQLKKFFFNGPADLVIEVISTESRSRDRGEKFYEYEEGGVREYWLIDPHRKQAEFYQREDSGFYRARPTNETGIYHSEVLPGLWIKVDWLWQEPLPKLLSILKEWKLV